MKKKNSMTTRMESRGNEEDSKKKKGQQRGKQIFVENLKRERERRKKVITLFSKSQIVRKRKEKSS